MLRSIGLADPERTSPTGVTDANNIGTPGARRRFSASDSIKAATAFLNNNVNPIGSQCDADLPTGADSGALTNFGPEIDVMIFNIKTRNLKSTATVGTINPYLTFSISSNIPEQKTKVQFNSSDQTVWTEDIVFRGLSLGILKNLTLDVKVFDKDRIRGKKLLGTTAVLLSILEIRSIDTWVALEGGYEGNGGEVHLSIMKRP